MPRFKGIEAVTSERVRALGQWWHRASAGRPMPDRADFDPAEWKPLLPYLLLSEISHQPFRIRYRLVGTAVVYAVGFDFTGRYLDAMLNPDAGESWIENYRAAHDRAAPVYGTTTVPTVNGDPFEYSYGIFPVTADQGQSGADQNGAGRPAQFIAIEDYGAMQPRVQSTLLDITTRLTRG